MLICFVFGTISLILRDSAQNYIYHTSGRGPKCGGTSGHNALIHAYNNLFENIKGHAFDVGVGSSVLLEGNQFNNVTTVALSTVSGSLYYVDTVAQAGTPCTSALGRTCEWNKYSSSGSVPLTYQTTSVLSLHGANVCGFHVHFLSQLLIRACCLYTERRSFIQAIWRHNRRDLRQGERGRWQGLRVGIFVVPEEIMHMRQIGKWLCAPG